MEHHSDAMNKMFAREVSEEASIKFNGRGTEKEEKRETRRGGFHPSKRTQGARAQKKNKQTNNRNNTSGGWGGNKVVKC